MHATILALAFCFFPLSGALALGQGEFLPLADTDTPFTRVHFVPKNGNKVLISCVEETIPPGIGVVSGGVTTHVLHTSTDKVPNQRLKPLTVYFAYVFMDERKMTLDFSERGHAEDATCGSQVHRDDPSRSLVGIIRTDENGKIKGNTGSQMLVSWFNRGHTGLAAFIGWAGQAVASTCSSTPVEVGPEIEWLTFGINASFPQSFTMPNLYVTGTVENDTPGGEVHVQLAVNGHVFSAISSHYQASRRAAGTVHNVLIGGFGATEGYIRGRIVMSNGGTSGCVTMRSGTLYTSPLHS